MDPKIGEQNEAELKNTAPTRLMVFQNFDGHAPASILETLPNRIQTHAPTRDV
jgi:hypothetical protein